MRTKIIIENIRVPISAADAEILAAAEKVLKREGICYDAKTLHLYRRSVDARHKQKISFVSSVIVESDFPPHKISTAENIRVHAEEVPEIPVGSDPLPGRPVIVGFGPAGIFSALLLARAGMRPLVLERGAPVSERQAAVQRFTSEGILDPENNVQFGAGGAGTFSDGKLTTRIGDGKCRFVLETLHTLGAPEDILWRAKPHIGTDVLCKVIENADREIRSLGGEIRYHAKVASIGEGWVSVAGEKIPCGPVILATGHSSRDTYAHLLQSGYHVTAKPFSVGVRIEHLQEEMDIAMYGDPSLSQRLGHAEYQVSYRQGARGVYSFCMCPGGQVMAAASEFGGVVTNGMSRHARDLPNCNAAIAVSVLPEDFGGDPEGAIRFQRDLEQAAFRAGGGDYSAPCQSVGAFYAGRSGGYGNRIVPSYRNGRVQPADFNVLLPGFVSGMLQQGLRRFGRKIRGFDAPDVPLTGIETRTSAPVRILRGEDLTAPGHSNVYPCGEGAGYAGGIMSAAVDGMRVALAILGRYRCDS